MTPIENLLSRLPGAKKAGKQWIARCPAHDDRKASLSISVGDEGRVLVKCHAGCTMAAIAAAVSMNQSEFFAEPPGTSPKFNSKPNQGGKAFLTAQDAVTALERQLGKRSAWWTYHDAEKNPVGLVIRWDSPSGKEFRPVSYCEEGWRIRAMLDPRPLYGLPELATAQRVIVTEGEKAADAARSIGFTATTSAGGSQAASKTDWRPLAGKDIIILPDNDPAGEKYADDVARLAHTAGARGVRILRLADHAPQLPNGGDLADVLRVPGWCGLPLGNSAKLVDLAAVIERLAQEVEPWRPNAADDLAYRPFPVHLLPEPIRSYASASAAAIGCDPVFIALPMLAALASAIGSRRRIRLKRRWTEPAIVWALTVATSGSYKSPGFDSAMLPVWRRQESARRRHSEALKNYAEDLVQYKASLQAWKAAGSEGEKPREPTKPVMERAWTDNTTMEALATLLADNPRGVPLACDELSAWFGSFDRYSKNKVNADAARWMHLHGGRSFVIDRKTGNPPTIFVANGTVSVAGGIQPGVLRRTLTLEHQESGMAARFLFAMPPKRQKQWTEAEIDEQLEVEVLTLFDRLYDLQSDQDESGNPIARTVKLSSAAKYDVWIPFYNAHGAEQISLDDDLSAAWSKLEGYAARLALVHHLARVAANDPTLGDPDAVDTVSMAASIALSKWFGYEAKRIYGMLHETDADRDQRRLVEWIERRGGSATAREVQQGCRWLKAPGAAEAALGELAKAGRGTWEPTPVGTRGQPTRRFKLPEASTVYGNGIFPEVSGNSVDVDAADVPGTKAKVGEVNLFGGTASDGPYRERH
jgi:hypothetical protein